MTSNTMDHANLLYLCIRNKGHFASQYTYMQPFMVTFASQYTYMQPFKEMTGLQKVIISSLTKTYRIRQLSVSEWTFCVTHSTEQYKLAHPGHKS